MSADKVLDDFYERVMYYRSIGDTCSLIEVIIRTPHQSTFEEQKSVQWYENYEKLSTKGYVILQYIGDSVVKVYITKEGNKFLDLYSEWKAI